MLGPLSRFLTYAGVSHRLVLTGDGPMRTELEAQCPGAVFTGALTPEAFASVMASADIFVFPSRTDTAGT